MSLTTTYLYFSLTSDCVSWSCVDKMQHARPGAADKAGLTGKHHIRDL